MKSIMKTLKCGTTIAALILMTGCATSPKVQVVQPGDNRLDCALVQNELAELDRAEGNVNEKKGMNGTNIAAAIFWLPGLLYTFYDAGKANDLIRERRSNLTKIYNDKGC